MLTTHVFVTFQVAGFHCWPEAPAHLAFLRDSHRHQFHVRVELEVESSRQVEFFELEAECKSILAHLGNRMPLETLDFQGDSCENIAAYLLMELIEDDYKPTSVSVSEDGQHGAVVRAVL